MTKYTRRQIMEAIEYWREKIRRGEYAPVDEGLKDSLGKLKKKVKGVVDKVTAALKKDAEEGGKNSPEYCFVRMYCFIKQELEQNNGKLHRPTVRAELYKIAAQCGFKGSKGISKIDQHWMDEYENYKGDSAYGELGDLIRDLYLYSEKN